MSVTTLSPDALMRIVRLYYADIGRVVTDIHPTQDGRMIVHHEAATQEREASFFAGFAHGTRLKEERPE